MATLYGPFHPQHAEIAQGGHIVFIFNNFGVCTNTRVQWTSFKNNF